MFKSIVWATDGSENAERALPYVQELAPADESVSITIVHVAELGYGAGAVFMPGRGEERQVVDRLREIADDLRQKGFTVSIEVRDEVGVRPAYEIAHIADRVGADLIIAGSRGLSTIGGLILGSVTHRLLHIARCPVLVVPPSEAERAA